MGAPNIIKVRPPMGSYHNPRRSEKDANNTRIIIIASQSDIIICFLTLDKFIIFFNIY